MIRTLGFQPEELVNVPVIERMIHPDDQKKVKEAFLQIIEKGEGGGIQYRHRHKNGGWVDLEAWGTDQLNNPDIKGVVINCRVITERKRAEADLQEREQQLQLFIEHAPAAVAMFDTQMRYISVSQQWQSDYGLTGDDLKGRCHYDVFPEISEEWKGVHRRCLQGATESSEEDAFVRASGEVQWLRWEVRPWFTGAGIVGGIVIFAEDITGRKQFEDALKLAKEQAEEANRYKTEFLMNISHDLRTPLHAILGFAHTLMSVEMEEKYHKGVEYINERARHLLIMVEEILRVSKIESGKIEIKSQELDLFKLLENAIAASRAELGDKDVKITLSLGDPLPHLKGDALRVQQIIDNLLSNAVKYTPQGSISMTVGLDKDQPSLDKCRVRISVKDTGIGISAEHLPHIFESFTRFHEFYEGKRYDGVGLGLYIVKRLISLMGGDILVASEVGQGSEFTAVFNFDKV